MGWKRNDVMTVCCVWQFYCQLVDSKCSKPLGMEDGRIGDSQIRASSSYSHESVGPSAGRLNSEKGGGAWCPKNLITENMENKEFLEIDLEDNYVISAVVTQGRFANGRGAEFAEFYIIQYWTEGMENFIDYTTDKGENILEANKNTFAAVETKLDTAIVASKIRIIPFSKHARTICLRIELKGCGTNNDDPHPNLGAENSSEEREFDMEISEELDDPFLESEYMGVAVGVLVTVILLLIIVILFILYKNYLSPSAPLLAYSPGKYEVDLEVSPDMIYPRGNTRNLQLTPTTSEDNYTDSSVEYSSPLLSSHMRKHSGHSRHSIHSARPSPRNSNLEFDPCLHFPLTREMTVRRKESRNGTSPDHLYQQSSPDHLYQVSSSPKYIDQVSSCSSSSPQVHRTASLGGTQGILKHGCARDRQKSSPNVNWQALFPSPPLLQQSHHHKPHQAHSRNKSESGSFVV